MATKLALKSFRVKNFKAIRDSGVVKFTPLTVLIGDNGSGKSSLIEGLQTYQRIVTDGVDAAMGMWRGFEFIHNPPLNYGRYTEDPLSKISPIVFELSGHYSSPISQQAVAPNFRTVMKVNKIPNSELTFIEKEKVYYRNRKVLERDSTGAIQFINARLQFGIRPDHAIISDGGIYYYARGLEDDEIFKNLMGYGIKFDWQFLKLNPWLMGEPRLVRRTGGSIRLQSDGANAAEYLRHILHRYPDTFEGILETLQYVLPYMTGLEPILTDFLGYQAHLEMTEEGFRFPVMGWLLSTGTLRILALLALFRHPEPPPVIIIEEIENGLDPRSVQLIVEEIRRVTESGRSQIILTSHSPYLLDLFDLSHIVLVERRDGTPTFIRPDKCRELDHWKERFGPGRLMSSGRLRNRELA